MYKKIALSLCFTLFLGLLPGCSPNKILRLENTESKTQKTTEKSENTPNNEGIGTPIALPPSFNNEPLKPGQTQTAYMPNGLPALKPMKGINVDTLFSEKIKDSGQRFNRVENAVVDLRKEFEVYKPSIVRLAAVEADIQNLIKELEVLLQETPNQQQQPLDLISESEAELQVSQLNPQPLLPPEAQEVPKVTAKEPIIEPPTPRAAPPPRPEPKKPKPKIPDYDGIVAKNLRVGEHADKVRLVLDTNKNTSFNIDIDNDEQLIIIELPEARWISEIEKTFSHSKLLESYVIEPLNGDKGSMIILSLKKETKILQKNRLSPDNSNPYHRIYIDLKL